MRSTIILLILMGFSLNGLSQSTLTADNVLEDKLHNALEPLHNMRNGYRELDLRKITDFSWDSVYYFDGEEKSDDISIAIGSKWNGPDVPNLHKRLLFVQRSEVVAFADFDEENITYKNGKKILPLPIVMYTCPNSRQQVLARGSARFATFRYCERGFVQFALVPLDCLNNFRDMVSQGCPPSSETYHVK